MTFEILSSRTFGPASRFRLDTCRDRSGAVVFILLDSERVDDLTGLPAIVRQSETEAAAVAGFEPTANTVDDARPYVNECATLYCATGRPLRVQVRPPAAPTASSFWPSKPGAYAGDVPPVCECGKPMLAGRDRYKDGTWSAKCWPCAVIANQR